VKFLTWSLGLFRFLPTCFFSLDLSLLPSGWDSASSVSDFIETFFSSWSLVEVCFLPVVNFLNPEKNIFAICFLRTMRLLFYVENQNIPGEVPALCIEILRLSFAISCFNNLRRLLFATGWCMDIALSCKL